MQMVRTEDPSKNLFARDGKNAEGRGIMPFRKSQKMGEGGIVVFSKNPVKHFCFPYNFELTKRYAAGILTRP